MKLYHYTAGTNNLLVACWLLAEMQIGFLQNIHKFQTKMFCGYLWICTVYLDISGLNMFLLFYHLIDEKLTSFLTYLKSWWKVVLEFGKEHANQSNISRIMIGWSLKTKFEKSINFLVTPILSFPNLIF